jgi:hypothetical protein
MFQHSPQDFEKLAVNTILLHNFWVLMTLERQQPVQTITAPQRRVVGVGNVGRETGKATYTLYNPNSDHLDFQTVFYRHKKGFGICLSN